MSKLRLIKVGDFRELTRDFPDDYHFAIYAPAATVLVLDERKKHFGSVYLKEEIEINKEDL